MKALLGQPVAQSSLLLGLQRLVQSLPHCKMTLERQQLMQQIVQPFVSFVMLCPDSSGELQNRNYHRHYMPIHSAECCCRP